MIILYIYILLSTILTIAGLIGSLLDENSGVYNTLEKLKEETNNNKIAIVLILTVAMIWSIITIIPQTIAKIITRGSRWASYSFSPEHIL